MKKCKLLLILLLLGTTAGRAQSEKETSSRWSVTPHIGANLWTARYNLYTDEPMDRRLGLTAGVEVGYEVVPRVSVSLGADYALQRFAQDAPGSSTQYAVYTGDKSITIATGRVYLPLMLGVNVWRGLSFRCGVQPGITLHSNTAEWAWSTALSYEQSLRMKYHFDRMHWYLPLGMSYEYRHWVADLRYSYSLKKNHWKTTGYTPLAYSWSEANTNAHDSMLQLTLGYRFRL